MALLLEENDINKMYFFFASEKLIKLLYIFLKIDERLLRQALGYCYQTQSCDTDFCEKVGVIKELLVIYFSYS